MVDMRRRLSICLVTLSLACSGCGSSLTMSNLATSGNPTGSPTWTAISVPTPLKTNGGSYSVQPDGNLYAESPSESAQSATKYILRTSVSNPGTWTDLTGSGLSNSAGFLGAMGMMPNGTILVEYFASGGGTADVFAWNSSIANPTWSRITGWNGVSPSQIYGFANDSAGFTYFSPTWSGDIWRNDAPNSLNFTKVQTNLYSVTNGGASGHPTTGGLYALKIFNLADGKGDMIWTCGEGELDNIALNFSAASNTAYLTTAKGYSGNCTAVDKSPTTILALRRASPALDAGTDTLTGINIATRATTVHPSPSPRSSTSFPPNLDMNVAGTLHWMSGTTWILSGRDANSSTLSYLLLSQDDGVTWTDITATGAIDSSCKGSNLSIGATASDHYVFARCQGGTVLWRYGPV